jgi:hypothetical protein
MKCTYIHNGKSYRSVEDLLKGLNGIPANLSEEVEWLNSVLPEVPVQIANTLLNLPGDKVAEGMFSKGVITLMRGARQGVGYHEAFHAVTQMYLSDDEVSKLYDQLRASEGVPMTNLECEEFLAEEFRVYVANRKAYPNKIVQWLFDQIEKLLNFCKEDRYKLFTKIAQGGFKDSSPVKKSDSILYSESDEITMTSSEKKAALNLSVFMIHKWTTDTPNLTDNEVFDFLKADWSDVDPDATAETLSFYKSAVENFDKLKPLIKQKLKEYDINSESVKDADGNDTGVEKFTQESNQKDLDSEGSAIVRLRLNFLYDKDKKNSITGLPQFEEPGTARRLLKEYLAGIVNTKKSSAWDTMVAKVEELSVNFPYLNPLVVELKSSGATLKRFQNAFFTEFSLAKTSCIQTNYEAIGNNDHKYTINHPVEKGELDRIGTHYDNIIKSKFTQVVTSDDTEYHDLDGIVLRAKAAIDNMGNREATFEQLLPVFESLGLPFNKDIYKLALVKIGVNKDAKSLRGQLKKALSIAKGDFKMTELSTSGNKNLFKNPVLHDYFQAVIEVKGSIGQSTVYTQDGVVFPITLNTFLSKELQRFATDPKHLNLAKTTDPWCANSIWLDAMVDKPLVTKFHAGVQTKEGFVNFGELTPVDELVERIKLSKDGWIAPISYADKKNMWFFEAPVRPSGMVDGVIPVATIDIVANYIKDEIIRIKAVRSYKGKKVKSYHGKRGESFCLFPTLNFKKEWVKNGKIEAPGEVTNALINALYDIDGGMIADVTDPKLQPLLQAFVKGLLEQRMRKDISTASRIGVVQRSGGKKVSVLGFPEVTDEESLQVLFSNYVVGNIIGGIELTKVLFGDPAYYKSMADMSKRTPAIIAPGYDGAFKAGETYGVAVVNDINLSIEGGVLSEIGKAYREDFTNYFKKYRGLSGEDLEDAVVEAMSPYTKITKGDGISWITPERFMEQKRSLGEVSPEHEAAFKALMTPGTKVETQHLLAMQPQKGMLFERLYGDQDDQKGRPVYLKTSEMVLWPALVKGTPLEGVLSKMYTYGVSQLVSQQGIKAGEIASVDMYNGEYNVFQVSKDNWKLQQKLPTKYHEKGKALMVSPIPKVILANIDPTTKYGSRTGAEVIKDLYEITKKMSEKSIEKLKAKWGIKDGASQKQIDQAIRQDIIAKLKADNAPDSVISALESGMSFESIVGYGNKLESELLAKVTKASVRLKVNGGGFIQMPSEGMLKTSWEDVKDVDGIIYFTEEGQTELKPPRIEDGVVKGGQVFLPQRVIKAIPGWEYMKPSELKAILAESGILEGLVGCRIPLQGPSFIDLLEVVGILPECAGDSMVVYGTMPAKNGSDFDIDKLFVYMPEFRPVYDYKAYMTDMYNYVSPVFKSGEGTYAEFKDWREKHKKGINYEDLFKYELSEYKSDWKRIQKNRLTDPNAHMFEGRTEEEFLEKKKSEFIKKSKDRDDIIFKKYKEFVDKGKDKYFQGIEKVPSTEETMEGWHNKKLDIWRDILSESKKFSETVTPADSDWLKDNAYWCRYMGDVYPSLKPEAKAEFDKLGVMSKAQLAVSNDYFNNQELASLEWFDPLYQQEIRRSFAGGKVGVGILANHIPHHALGQMANLGIKNPYFGSHAHYRANGIVDLTKQFDNSAVKRDIFNTLSALLSGNVDIAKDPYIFYVNFNDYTANTIITMVRAGVDPVLINVLMSQPIIKELVAEHQRSESALFTEDGIAKKPYEKVMRNRKGANTDKVTVPKSLDYTLGDYNIASLAKALTENDNDEQIKLLDLFMKLKDAGDSLNQCVSTCKIDTNGYGSNLTEGLVTMELRRELLDNEEAGRSNSIVGYSRLFQETNLQTYGKTAINTSIKYVAPLFSHGSREVKSITQRLFTSIGRKYVNNVSLARKVALDYYTYKLSNFGPLKVTEEERKSLLGITPSNRKEIIFNWIAEQGVEYEKLSSEAKDIWFIKGKKEAFKKDIGERVLEMQQLLKSKKISNILLDEIQPKSANTFFKSYADLYFPSLSKTDSTAHDNLVQAFSELLNADSANTIYSALSKSERKDLALLARDMIKQQYIRTGFNPSRGSFFQFIPPSFMQAEGLVEHMETVPDSEKFLEQFLLHNTEDSNLCLKVTSGTFPGFMDSTGMNLISSSSKLLKNKVPIPLIKMVTLGDTSESDITKYYILSGSPSLIPESKDVNAFTWSLIENRGSEVSRTKHHSYDADMESSIVKFHLERLTPQSELELEKPLTKEDIQDVKFLNDERSFVLKKENGTFNLYLNDLKVPKMNANMEIYNPSIAVSDKHMALEASMRYLDNTDENQLDNSTNTQEICNPAQ